MSVADFCSANVRLQPPEESPTDFRELQTELREPSHQLDCKSFCAQNSQQETDSCLVEQRSVSQQDRVFLVSQPKQNGLIVPFGQRQTKWGTPATSVVIAVTKAIKLELRFG